LDIPKTTREVETDRKAKNFLARASRHCPGFRDLSLQAPGEILSWARVTPAEYHLYSALAHAAGYDAATLDKRPQYLDAIAAHHRQLQIWSENCPDNFENRAALVGAEIARIEGRVLDAMTLYEQAVRSARGSGYVHNEAISNETAARFYAARGFEDIAQLYLRKARYFHLRWGALGNFGTRQKL
jgi:tetratricopeptide (TPR) repeat protein